MKKVVACLLTVFFVLSVFATVANANDTSTMVINTNANNRNVNNSENNVITTNESKNTATEQIWSLKETAAKKLEDFQSWYGSDTYGLVAYILNIVRIYSIPLCFVGIAISAIYQYVLGIRKLDVRDKGFNFMIAIITIGVICQVLPLIFAIVVKGWRG